jgi:hypothetical protein
MNNAKYEVVHRNSYLTSQNVNERVVNLIYDILRIYDNALDKHPSTIVLQVH